MKEQQTAITLQKTARMFREIKVEDFGTAHLPQVDYDRCELSSVHAVALLTNNEAGMKKMVSKLGEPGHLKENPI